MPWHQCCYSVCYCMIARAVRSEEIAVDIKGVTMRSWIIIALLLGCMLWPASADLSDFQPIVQYTLPADIMQVDFAHETWVYRLYEDGTVKKVVNKRMVHRSIYATRNEPAPDHTVSG